MAHQHLQKADPCEEMVHTGDSLDTWVDENFDFEEWLRRSGATELPTSDLSPAYEKHPQILDLEAASAVGDTNAVQEILQRWQDTPEDERCHKDQFASFFEFAMKGNHMLIASCLADNGIKANWANFDRAMQLKCYPNP